ncbi:hypothetical protein, partial [Klebsiella pneumoniae]
MYIATFKDLYIVDISNSSLYINIGLFLFSSLFIIFEKS